MGRITDRRREVLARKYAGLLIKGVAAIEAWRTVFPKRCHLPAGQQHARHSEWKRDPVVARQVHEAFAQLHISDLYSKGQWIADLLQDIEKSRENDNMTAVMQGMRMAGQASGGLQEHIMVSDERVMPDDKLLDQLSKAAGIDVAQLRMLVGRGGFGQETTPEPAESVSHEGQSKLTH